MLTGGSHLSVVLQCSPLPTEHKVPSSTPCVQTVILPTLSNWQLVILICVLPLLTNIFHTKCPVQTCCWRGHLCLKCFNCSILCLTKVQLFNSLFQFSAFPTYTLPLVLLSVDPADCFQGILFKQWQGLLNLKQVWISQTYLVTYLL